MTVRLKDIAEKAGVTANTVSCALRGVANLDVNTRARIVKLAAEMGYRPNAHARSMRSGKFHCLGLLQDPNVIRSELNPQLFQALMMQAEKRAQKLALLALPDEHMDTRHFVPLIFRELMADGLLINYHNQMPAQMASLIERHRIPHLHLNRKGSNCCVYPDEFGAAQFMTKHMLELGHQRIAYLDLSYHHVLAPERHYSRTDRMAGYVATMEAAGLQSMPITDNEIKNKEQVHLWLPLIIEQWRPTAILCHTSRSAEQILDAAPFLKLKIPEDLSIGLLVLNFHLRKRPVAMVSQNWEQVAIRAMDTLIANVDSKQMLQPSIKVPFQVESINHLRPPASRN